MQLDLSFKRRLRKEKITKNNPKSFFTVSKLAITLVLAFFSVSACISSLPFLAPQVKAETDTITLNSSVSDSRSVSAPADFDATVDWNSTSETSAKTVTYTTTYSNDDLTADIKSGDLPTTYVSGFKLSIKPSGGSYTNLVTGNTDGSSAILASGISDVENATIDVYFKLDATGVAADAANLGANVEYTITYTIS